MLKHFLHLDEIPRWFYQQNIPNAPWKEIYNPADEYNEIGSRYSAKTFAIKDNPIGKSCAISLLVNKPIFIIAVMKMNKDIRNGVFKNIQNTLNDMNINYKVNLSENSFTLDNGTYIFCKGLHSQTKREKLKAFADLNNYEFAIEWREEADQLTQEDISELSFAVRGAKRKFIINSSNPESLGRYIIKYCNEIMPFNEQLMRLKYDQIGKFKINYYEKDKKFTKTIIIHYSSWRLNTYLSNDIVRDQLEMERGWPSRARVWSWGLPGQVQGAVFAEYLKFTKLTWTFDKILAGVDYAQADIPNAHKTSASLWVYNSTLKKVHKIGKYTHSNATMEHRNVFEQAHDIIQFYLSSLKNSTIFIENGLTINVDYGGGGKAFIDVLNKEKRKYKYGTLLRFEEVDKSIWNVTNRVNSFLALMITDKMTHDLILEESNKEYPMIQWKEKPNGGKEEIVDLYDDEFDADYYALSEYIRDIVQSSTNRLIREYV
ncbi:adhesin P58 [Spiroplasma kunkelii CR2-3x]|uniref:Adhesin P58 n=1 Tax=Spiroplasma kunkelii CR2-3x TaxID=273035 RepID=A0A0K2JGA9_SPIKU|nr:PBSX family phage terminase large subunit [Spiroplasma kunkelii]ALA97629.1 adhesin P58 [Spiroplasma kunkelii CR2-3x]